MSQTSHLAGNGIPMSGTLILQSAQDTSQSIEIPLKGTEGYILGRSDTRSSYAADVDLSELGALDHGVSRRHAALVYYDYRIHLVDLSSVNGSLVNGHRLMAETPYPLNDGDQLTLGQLVMTVFHRQS